MADTIGWIATAVFSASYFFRSASALRWVQALAACLWIGYGMTISSKPVIGANAIVAAGAIVSTLRRPTRGEEARGLPPDSRADQSRTNGRSVSVLD